MILNISNIKEQSQNDNPIIYRYCFNATKWKQFELMQELHFLLPNNVLRIPKGFKWDLSSVPSFLWWLLKPFGRYDAAYLIHDYLYQNKGLVGGITYTRKECDKIMRDYALALVDTNKISLRRIDVWVRYYAVRLVGGMVWNKNK